MKIDRSLYGLDKFSVIVTRFEDSKSFTVRTEPIKDDEVIERTQGFLPTAVLFDRPLQPGGEARATFLTSSELSAEGFSDLGRTLIRAELIQGLGRLIADLDELENGDMIQKVAGEKAENLLINGIDPATLTFEVICRECGPDSWLARNALKALAGQKTNDPNVLLVPGAPCRLPAEYRRAFDEQALIEYKAALEAQMIRMLPKMEEQAARWAANLAAARKRLFPESAPATA